MAISIDGLERLKNTNSSIEDCAAQYPQHQDELVEILGLVSSLNSLGQISPRGRFTENAGKRLVSKLPDRNVNYGQKTRPIRRKRKIKVNFRRSFSFVQMVLLVVMLLSAITGGTAFAADFAEPGDLLYELDLTIEQVQLKLAPNLEAVIRIHLEIADERLEEAQNKLYGAELEKSDIAFEAYRAEIATLAKLVGRENGANREALSELVDTALSKHKSILEELLKKFPSYAQPGIERALEASAKPKKNTPMGPPEDKTTGPPEDKTTGKPEGKTTGKPEDKIKEKPDKSKNPNK
jgi:hypothetical protein